MEQSTWMTTLQEIRAQGEAYPLNPLPETVTLPDHLTFRLSKAQIVAFLGLPSNTPELKPALLQRLLLLLETDQRARAQFFAVFVQEMAVEPAELETLLTCTPSERKRWVSDGKLPVIGYRTFHKVGRDLAYPIHDRRVILSLTQAEIERWRTEHQAFTRMRRKTGVQKAQVSRKVNQQTREELFSTIEEMVREWEQYGSPELVAALNLAYWTRWASRWAKENQVKNLNAIKYHALYQQRRDTWYRRKSEAIQVLARTPYGRLAFYQPEQSDKWTLELCDEHYEMRKELYYENKWAFFADFSAEIHLCPHCHASVEKDYYSLYHIEITTALFPELRFSFHLPYPIGKAFLPSAKKLPHVEHTEQDGIFRFGRPLFDDEKILYREKDVEAKFAQALVQAQSLYGEDKREG